MMEKKMETTISGLGFGVSQNEGYLSGGSWNKDDCIWGCILGSPYL